MKVKWYCQGCDIQQCNNHTNSLDQNPAIKTQSTCNLNNRRYFCSESQFIPPKVLATLSITSLF